MRDEGARFRYLWRHFHFNGDQSLSSTVVEESIDDNTLLNYENENCNGEIDADIARNRARS